MDEALGYRYVKNPSVSGSEGWHADVDSMCRNIHHSFLLSDVYGLKAAPLQKLLLLRFTKPRPLYPAVNNESHSLVQLYDMCVQIYIYIYIFLPYLRVLSDLPSGLTGLQVSFLGLLYKVTLPLGWGEDSSASRNMPKPLGGR